MVSFSLHVPIEAKSAFTLPIQQVLMYQSKKIGASRQIKAERRRLRYDLTDPNATRHRLFEPDSLPFAELVNLEVVEWPLAPQPVEDR
jgi:hypothetical protein